MRLNRIMAFVAGAALCGCSSNAQKQEVSEQSPQTAGPKKALVAYYSATGNTERMAKAIAEAADADLYAITPEKPYSSADLDWRDSTSRSSIEMNDPASRPALGGEKIDASGYEVVFVGFPVWWDLCPRVVNTWIESQDLKGKKVVPFATSGGSTIANSVKDLRRLYPDINWQEGRLLNGNISEVAQWVNTLQLNNNDK